ncbi:unnamed protein product [Protopolystoma xenopodis]|uniref:SRCR domain-containing protein n=1 Tax=Protopolystoma xenopodis TaxID=117903 RepID=A0A448XLK8_9PLAT|nr:unnamed protein product [Protopolystoma xenopodis]
MPGVELRLESGVRLEFAPNIGLLVLGRLIARGEVGAPIQMDVLRQTLEHAGPSPVDSGGTDGDHNSPALKRQRPPNVVPPGSGVAKMEDSPSMGETMADFSLSGGRQFPNEGFVQFFNSTAQRWETVCDPLFSSQVGQVGADLLLSFLSIPFSNRPTW